MQNNWAAEHLQVIRTLMERSALYRRALAPIMTFVGLVGLVAALAGCIVRIESLKSFVGYWFAVAGLSLTGSFLLVRRQALRAAEPFWSPPTRRVALALCPPMLVGFLIGVGSCFLSHGEGLIFVLPMIWIILYGFALHSAGFFTPRGLQLFGWLFINGGMMMILAFLLFFPDRLPGPLPADKLPYAVMGFFFGALHLACGIYLYFTEKRRTAA